MSYDDGRLENSLAWMGWSYRVGRLKGIEYRISWTLFVTMAFAAVDCGRSHRFDLIPLALVIPPLAVLLHTWGHLLMLKGVKGSTDSTLLWSLGDMTPMTLPITPLKQFAVAAAGPIVSMSIWIFFEFCIRRYDPAWSFHVLLYIVGLPSSAIDSPDTGMIPFFLGYSAIMSFTLLIWNLFPSIVFDGGRMWRAVLWPIIGLRRAVWTCIYASFILSALLILGGFYLTDFLLVVFGAMMLFSTFMERRSMNTFGFDMVMNVEPGMIGKNRTAGFLDRWRAIRQAHLRAREEVQEQQEQEVLDRLLAKVSEKGLPSLTAAERQSLARISRQQKARTEAHSSFS